jgi:hypothetical protein
MADQSDVEAALVQIIEGVIYPNGLTGSPPLTVLDVPGRVYRGWPNGDALDADLRNNVFNISVYAANGVERNTTRFPRVWQQTAAPTATLTATVSGATVAIGGTVSTPTNIAIITDRTAYVYAVQSGDTLSSIAAALAALIPEATSSGPVVTLTDPIGLAAHCEGSGTAVKLVKQTLKQFQICFWCPSPLIRDQLVTLVDPVLASMDRFVLPDQTYAWIYFARSMTNDAPQKELLFRRDLFYMVEWSASLTQTFPAIATIETSLTPGCSGDSDPTLTLSQ